MRITRIERGDVSGQYYTGRYVEVYTQPISRVVVAWLYHHLWERVTWRFYRWLWKAVPHKPQWIEFGDGQVYDDAVPYVNRQDERCFDLSHTGRIEISETYDPPRLRIVGWSCEHMSMTGTGIVDRPTTSGCGCNMSPIYAT